MELSCEIGVSSTQGKFTCYILQVCIRILLHFLLPSAYLQVAICIGSDLILDLFSVFNEKVRQGHSTIFDLRIPVLALAAYA
ncbi:hypothetical protein NC653_008881 [Populus alba x Populus x berolinensis]|uniref:Uncharacterized protein n=1 Tax=Populus alba x Populus x berolinensis TaxID=444605 RepID=A0AAD6R7Y8_9ROSI|nr:hypothetical protein NC653_008881 [Populus alba x Populus x berolinensis]